jgi:riboflavin biosynthesis pyrimidine reductase
VEGGALILSSFLAAAAIDEVHAFIASVIAGSSGAVSAFAGAFGVASHFDEFEVSMSGTDAYIHGRHAQKHEPRRRRDTEKAE